MSRKNKKQQRHVTDDHLPGMGATSLPANPSFVAEFDKISKDYPLGPFKRGVIQALRDVSLKVRAGEVFGLLGPNRAGKTTLVKILLSLCQATSGRANRLGQSVRERRTLGRVGYVHENQALPRYLTATGLLEYYGALSLVPFEDVRRRVPLLLKRVGLADRGREPISRFSKGMVQRLCVAQALINEPDLLVLDEPSEGLDLEGRQLVRDLVAEQRRQGKTVILVSHVLSEVEKVCDRLAVIKEGRLAHQSTLEELTRPSSGEGTRSLEDALAKIYAGPV